MAIIYLHGFASKGDTSKTRALKAEFSDQKVFYPDLPVSPQAAVDMICDMIDNLHGINEKVLLIGSSLGGFLATHIANKYESVPAVVINPVIEPHLTMTRHLGTHQRYGTNETFEWTTACLDELRVIFEETVWSMQTTPAYMTVICAMDDDVVDNVHTVDYYKHYRPFVSVIHQPAGGHRYEHIEEAFPIIWRMIDAMNNREGAHL